MNSLSTEGSNMIFSLINILDVPREELKTEGVAALGFLFNFLRDLVNVNE